MPRQRSCPQCEELRADLVAARQELAAAREEVSVLKVQADEVRKLVELQSADLARYRALIESSQPNRPERAPRSELQLAFANVLATLGPKADVSSADNDDEGHDGEDEGGAAASSDDKTKKQRRRDPHGRRDLDLSKLPVEQIDIDPDEVREHGADGFTRIGEETTNRLAFRRGGYIVLRIVRHKWARKLDASQPHSDEGAPEPPPVVIGELPAGVWPNVMGDPSAIARVIVSKYDDFLPLHRQERISARDGFIVPRSTQSGWLALAHPLLRRIVDAMHAEALARAHFIATDATGAPVRARGGCEGWKIFVLVAEDDHVIFRHSREHTSEAIGAMLQGYRGHLVCDASSIYDALYRGGQVVEVACWSHLRRYVWKALETEKAQALEGLSIIAKLFAVDKASKALPMPQRTQVRAEHARPILRLFEAWVNANRATADPGGRLIKAIGYFDNQRAAFLRFLEDGRLPIHNNVSERQLRAVVLGRDNWHCFANERGLEWMATFRSLLASCRLHELNSHDYIEQVLRLAPHWPVNRVIKLAPKYWTRTVEGLDPERRAILRNPWERAPGAAQSALANAA